MCVPKKQWDGWPCAAGSTTLGARGAQSAGLAPCPNACLLLCIPGAHPRCCVLQRLTSKTAQGHPFVMFALGGAVGAAASQGYALLPLQPLHLLACSPCQACNDVHCAPRNTQHLHVSDSRKGRGRLEHAAAQESVKLGLLLQQMLQSGCSLTTCLAFPGMAW